MGGLVAYWVMFGDECVEEFQVIHEQHEVGEAWTLKGYIQCSRVRVSATRDCGNEVR